MKKSVVDAAKKVRDSGEQVARNIWLAGLGVYSKSLEEAQDLNGKTNALFDELVERGRAVESETKQKVAKTTEAARDSVDTRVNDLFHKLSGFDRSKLDEMNAKLDKLAAAVDKLTEEAK